MRPAFCNIGIFKVSAPQPPALLGFMLGVGQCRVYVLPSSHGKIVSKPEAQNYPKVSHGETQKSCMILGTLHLGNYGTTVYYSILRSCSILVNPEHASLWKPRIENYLNPKTRQNNSPTPFKTAQKAIILDVSEV